MDGPAPPALLSVLAFLETALGVPVRRVTELERQERLPARLLVAGPLPRELRLEAPTVVVHLPVPRPTPLPRGEWIEPGPLPVFGDFERYRCSGTSSATASATTCPGATWEAARR